MTDPPCADHPEKGHRHVRAPAHLPRSVDVAVLGVAIAWGSSYLAAKTVVVPDAVFAFLVIRFALAAGGLAIVSAAGLRRITVAELMSGVLFGVMLSVVFTLETLGLTMTSASNAGLIISLSMIMTPVFARSAAATRLPAAFYGSAVVAVAGVGLLTQTTGWTAPGLGDLLILLAAAARAAHITAIARLSRHRPLNPARVTLVQLCTGLVVFVALSHHTGRGLGPVAAHMSTAAWLLTVYLALVCTVVAFVVQAWAVRRTSPARVSLLLGTEPLWAAGIGVLFAGDSLTAVGVGGAVLVLVGTHWAEPSTPAGR
ncbi:hypothetical protein B1R94_23645 [Mycolicibacterium litorale]|nr:hypothetical protein B1R94_23645 [Mycolicibacterium litorale]